MEQWYEKHPEIQDLEKEAMKRVCPSAKYCYLPSGEAGWIVHVRPFINGERKEWILLIKYPSDYPSVANSIRCYPIKPSYLELQEMVESSNVIPKIIPFSNFDRDNNMYLPLCKDDDRRYIIRHATLAYARACKWIYMFELTINNQATWTLFQQKPICLL